jgi:hypothetical protein
LFSSLSSSSVGFLRLPFPGSAIGFPAVLLVQGCDRIPHPVKTFVLVWKLSPMFRQADQGATAGQKSESDPDLLARAARK